MGGPVPSAATRGRCSPSTCVPWRAAGTWIQWIPVDPSNSLTLVLDQVITEATDIGATPRLQRGQCCHVCRPGRQRPGAPGTFLASRRFWFYSFCSSLQEFKEESQEEPKRKRVMVFSCCRRAAWTSGLLIFVNKWRRDESVVGFSVFRSTNTVNHASELLIRTIFQGVLKEQLKKMSRAEASGGVDP